MAIHLKVIGSGNKARPMDGDRGRDRGGWSDGWVVGWMESRMGLAGWRQTGIGNVGYGFFNTLTTR